MSRFRFVIAAALVALPGSVLAQDGQVLATKFGALESIQQLAMSPDGNRVSIVAPGKTGGQVLYLADLTIGGLPKAIMAQGLADQNLRWCEFATNERLVCLVTLQVNEAGNLLGFTRMFSISLDGKEIKQLSARNGGRTLGRMFNGGGIIDWDLPGKPGKVLMTRDFLPEDTSASNIRSKGEGLGVEEVDVVTLSRRLVEKPRSEASEYISDGHGNVRIMGITPRDADGYMRGQVNYSFRKPGSREWDGLTKVVQNEAGLWGGFEPYAVDSTRNVTYGFDDQNGFTALYEVALDGSGARELVLGRSDVDVDALVQIGPSNRVVGASYATERRTVEFFDPELKKLATALGKALPGKPAISFVDSSTDESKLLLFASSDIDPGMFYRYDKTTRKLEPLLPARDQLAGLTMAEMKPVSFAAADGTQIPGYLTLPPGSNGKGLPAIVMPHGGPGARDEWGFDWLVQYYAMRGFAVLQPNFRGSAGYGNAWFRRNGFQSWRTAVGDVNDAGRWLVSQGIAAPDKLGIVGWSYGGYAALQSSVLDPNLFKAIVAIAPVTDLESLRAEAQDYANFPIVDKFIGSGPHVRDGSPARNALQIKAPVLLFHGDMDSNVGIAQSRLMANRLKDAGKQVQLVEFPKLDHALQSSAARSKMLAESDAFLRKNLGLPGN
jgi:dipeptidyl aminopeptidase/acylaminoacyl peptidase